MKKENIERIINAAKEAAASTTGISAETYVGMNDEERVLFNKTVSVNEDLTLREIKERIGSTRGKAIMTVKGLRRTGTLVAAQNAFDCRMEVYDNGFAVYRTCHETVLRMEYVGKVFCKGEAEIGIRNETVDLSEEGWGNAVMLCAESRLDDEYDDKSEKTMVSISGNAHCGEDGEEGDDLEFDSGVDIEGSFIEACEREELWAKVKDILTERQYEAVELSIKEQLSQPEIAERMGIAQPTVKVMLDRAFARLRKKF